MIIAQGSGLVPERHNSPAGACLSSPHPFSGSRTPEVLGCTGQHLPLYFVIRLALGGNQRHRPLLRHHQQVIRGVPVLRMYLTWNYSILVGGFPFPVQSLA